MNTVISKCVSAPKWVANRNTICEVVRIQRSLVNSHVTHMSHRIQKDSWNWWDISSNPNITFDDVMAHSELPWNWFSVSRNPNITSDIVQSYPDKPWDWKYLLNITK